MTTEFSVLVDVALFWVMRPFAVEMVFAPLHKKSVLLVSSLDILTIGSVELAWLHVVGSLLFAVKMRGIAAQALIGAVAAVKHSIVTVVFVMTTKAL